MNKPNFSEQVNELLDKLQLTAGERMLWSSLLHRCLSQESQSFINACIENGFDRSHFRTMVDCLSFGLSQTFSGVALDNLLARANSEQEVFLSIAKTLRYLQKRQLKAEPVALIAYLECAQQSIELGRESGSLLDTVQSYLNSAGIHEAVPSLQSD